jgi:hypothetical protein
MNMHAQVQQRDFAEPSIGTLELTLAIAPPFGDADAVRHSESNILQWAKYLPEDCINKMIEMRWDVTT